MPLLDTGCGCCDLSKRLADSPCRWATLVPQPALDYLTYFAGGKLSLSFAQSECLPLVAAFKVDRSGRVCFSEACLLSAPHGALRN